MVFTSEISNEIFENYPKSSDELIVISGWVSPSEIENVLSNNLETKILYGMTSRGIPEPVHFKFIDLSKTNDKLSVYYALPQNEVHAKCYIWKQHRKIIKCLVGSANFTHSGLNSPQKEILVNINSDKYGKIEQYINSVLESGRRENCTEKSLNTKIIKLAEKTPISAGNTQELVSMDTIRMTFLDSSGNLPPESGLNWGQGSGHVKPNDSYIRITKAALKTGFFKPKTSKQIAIDAMWDDRTAMGLYEEGNQEFESELYPKQLASAKSKEILGKYLRKRLGVKSGDPITLNDLNKYGRTNVDITIVADKSYYLDFSV